MNKYRYVTRVALTVAMGGFLMGFDASVISGVVKFIEKLFFEFFVLKERDAVRKVCRPILVLHLMGMPDLQLRQPACEIRTVDPERSNNRDDQEDKPRGSLY